MRTAMVFVVSAALLWTIVPTAWAQQGPVKCRLKADPLRDCSLNVWFNRKANLLDTLLQSCS